MAMTKEEAKKAMDAGKRVLFSAKGVPIRILNPEEERDEDWDEEYMMPKRAAAFFRIARANLESRKRSQKETE